MSLTVVMLFSSVQDALLGATGASIGACLRSLILEWVFPGSGFDIVSTDEIIQG